MDPRDPIASIKDPMTLEHRLSDMDVEKRNKLVAALTPEKCFIIFSGPNKNLEHTIENFGIYSQSPFYPLLLQLVLRAYIADCRKDERKSSKGLFGRRSTISKKIEAAETLEKVMEGKVSNNVLPRLEKVLNHSTLGEIYRRYQTLPAIQKHSLGRK